MSESDKGDPKVYRCSSCDINYPTSKDYRACLVCGDETWETTFKDGFDDDWRDKVAKLQFTEPRPLFLGEIPDADITVMHHAGKLWVNHQQLIEAGYRFLEDFGVVKINGVFYELQGHVGREQNRIPGGAWWLEEIPIEGAFDKLPVLSNLEYQELELKRGLRT